MNEKEDRSSQLIKFVLTHTLLIASIVAAVLNPCYSGGIVPHQLFLF